MNIGMILDTDFPPDPRVENEAVTLIAAGFEVSLFCLDYKNKNDSRETIHGIKVFRKACPNWVYKSSALAYTIPLYHWVTKKWIGDFIKEAEVDALHIHDMQIAQAIFDLPESKDMPIVLDLHEMRPEIMKFYNHLHKFPGKYLIQPKTWAKAESSLIERSSKTVVVTEEAKNYYAKKLNLSSDHFIVVPNTVRKGFTENADIKDEIVNKYKGKFVVLYVGDTGLRRGLMTVLEAMPELKEKIDNMKLVIVGSNKSDVVLKNFVKEKNLAKWVDFEGWKDFTLFQSYISVSDICISPLHRNLHHDTTYANKIFQYMALGKPIVVSDCLSQESVVKRANSGLVFEAENVLDFTRKIGELSSNKELRDRLGANGSKFAREQFNWETTSQGLIDFYKEL